MTITVELKNEKALALLKTLEQLDILKLLLPSRMPAGEAVPNIPGEPKPSDSNQLSDDAANGKLAKLPDAGLPNETGDNRLFFNSPDVERLLENDPSGFGCLQGKIHLAADWEAPLEDFKEYMY
jgi:hypothetical protein